MPCVRPLHTEPQRATSLKLKKKKKKFQQSLWPLQALTRASEGFRSPHPTVREVIKGVEKLGPKGCHGESCQPEERALEVIASGLW